MTKSVAIVTGANSGIGKATALRLARDFGAVVLAARGGERLAAVGEQVKAIGAEPMVLELDLMAATAAETAVQVNSVSPGAIMTSRRQAMLEKAAAAKNIGLEEMKKLFVKRAGISRFGEAEEIADVMAFAVSPAARWMTGTVLRMDGGEVKSI